MTSTTSSASILSKADPAAASMESCELVAVATALDAQIDSQLETVQELIQEQSKQLLTAFRERLQVAYREGKFAKHETTSMGADSAAGPPSSQVDPEMEDSDSYKQGSSIVSLSPAVAPAARAVAAAAAAAAAAEAASPPRPPMSHPNAVIVLKPPDPQGPAPMLRDLGQPETDDWSPPLNLDEDSPRGPSLGGRVGHIASAPGGVFTHPQWERHRPGSLHINATLRSALSRHTTMSSQPTQKDPGNEGEFGPVSSRISRLAVPSFLRPSRMSANPVTDFEAEMVQDASSLTAGSFRPSVKPRASIMGLGATKKVFADAAVMKEQVKEALQRPEYNVTSLYHQKGFCQWVCRSRCWDNTTLFVIFCNAIWLAVDTEINQADLLIESHPIVQVIEHFFCFFFTMEWILRFGAFEMKSNCVLDRAFVFDTVLCIMSIGETWIMTLVVVLVYRDGDSKLMDISVLRMFRLVRILRMARVLRLLRAFPELMVLIKGIVSAGRSVFFTLSLLFVVIFIFAVTFRQMTKDTNLEKQYFSSLGDSMFSLLVFGTVPDMADFIVACTNEGVLYGILVLVYILGASFTVMNLLIGVIVQVVDVVSQVENAENTVKDVRRRLLSALTKLFLESQGESTNITKAEFQRILTDSESARAIHDLGVDVVGLLDSVDFIFQDSTSPGEIAESITFGSFMEAVLLLRGTNQATVKNIVDLRKFFTHALMHHERAMVSKIQTSIHEVLHQLSLQKKGSPGTQSAGIASMKLDGHRQTKAPCRVGSPAHYFHADLFRGGEGRGSAAHLSALQPVPSLDYDEDEA